MDFNKAAIVNVTIASVQVGLDGSEALWSALCGTCFYFDEEGCFAGFLSSTATCDLFSHAEPVAKGTDSCMQHDNDEE